MAVIIPIETKYNPRGVQTAIRNLDDFKKAVDKAGGGFDGFAKVTGRMMQAVGADMQQAGRSMSLGLTLPLVGIGAAAVATQAEFETAMNQLAVATGAPEKQIQQLTDVAKTLGRDTVFSANEAANAMLELAKGGFTPAEIAGGGVQATMALAATEGMSLADAALIASNAMNTFGIKASQASTIADALAGGSIASSASVEGLAQALSQVGPGATNAGLNLQQTVGVLAAFADSGIKGSDAGTSLKTMLARLVPQTDKAKAAMKELGLDFTNARGEIIPITKVAEQLQDKLGGLSEAQRITALQTIFGSDATRAATVLMKQGAEGLAQYITATNNQGAAQEMANARMKGTAGAMEQLKGSIETALLSIGEALAPIVTKVAAFIKEWVDRFESASPAVKQVVVVVGILAAAIGPLLIVLGAVISALGTVVAALGAISLPVVAVIAGIAAFVAILVLLWNKSEAFRNAVKQVWDAVRDAVARAVDAVKQKLDENRDKIDALKDAFSKIWSFIKDTLAPLLVQFYGQYLKTLITVIGFVIGKVIDFAAFLFDLGVAIFNAGRKAWEFAVAVKDGIVRAIDFVKGIPGKVMDALKNAGQWLVDTGKNMIQGLLDGAGSLLSKIGEFFLDKLPGWIVGPFKRALGIASPSKVFEGFGRNIGDGLIKGSDGKRGAVEAASRRLGDAMKRGTKGALKNAIEGATEVKGGAEGRLSRLREYFNRLRDIIVDAFAKLKEKAQAEVDRLSGVLEDLKQQAQAYRDSIRSALTVGFSVDTSGQQSVLERFRQGIKDAQEFAGQIQQLRAFGLNETSLQNIIQAGVEQGKQIAASLLSGGSGAIAEVNALQAAFDEQVGALSDQMAQDKFGQQIAQAKAALEAAQASFAAIEQREREQLAALNAMATAFGVNTDAMELTLDNAQQRIEDLLGQEDTATSLLSEAVTEVTTGLLTTASQMAAQAAALKRRIDNLSDRISEAERRLANLSGSRDGSRAVGGPVMAGRSYLVGEQGPELFVPNVSGTVLTARETRSLGGVTIAPGAVSVTVNGGDGAQVQAVVDEAFARLVRELQAL